MDATDDVVVYNKPRLVPKFIYDLTIKLYERQKSGEYSYEVLWSLLMSLLGCLIVLIGGLIVFSVIDWDWAHNNWQDVHYLFVEFVVLNISIYLLWLTRWISIEARRICDAESSN